VLLTLKELRWRVLHLKQSQLLQSCDEPEYSILNPGFQSKPWAEICERFQRFGFTTSPYWPGMSQRFQRLGVTTSPYCIVALIF